MKKSIKIVIILLSIMLICFSTFSIAANTNSNENTTNNTSTNTINEPEETYEFVNSDIYRIDKNISITEIVDGNIFAFGNHVTISGEIGGDVFVFADTVTFESNAYVHGNIFVFAQSCSFSGIAYDIYGAVSQFKLEEGAIIARDIKIAAAHTAIYGSVKRDAYIMTENLEFPDHAKDLIAGNLFYTAKNELNFNHEIVSGEVSYTPKANKELSIASQITSYINQALSTLLYTLVIVLLAVWLAPRFTQRIDIILKKKPLVSLGIGILSSIVMIAASIALLLLTYGLGFGISFAAITIFILLLTITKTIFSMAIAKLLGQKYKLEKTFQFVLLTLASSLIITLIGFIPYIGGICLFIVNMLGLGIFVYHLICKQDLTDEVVIENK